MSNQNVFFEITTTMESDDYRKFSYMTVFRKKWQTITLIVVLAAVGAGFWVLYGDSISIPKFLLAWVVLIVLAFAAIFLRVEYRNLNRMNMVRAGLASVRQTILFYEHHLTATESHVSGKNKHKYDNLHQVQETKDYYIIFANANSASIIRKKDIHKDDREEFRSFLKSKMGSRYKNLVKDKNA